MKQVTKEEWKKCQDFERKSWGDKITLETSGDEKEKQKIYAKLMGINISDDTIDAEGKNILDLGCGPISLLLRTKNFLQAYGVEPLDYGEIVNKNYYKKNITIIKKPIEEIDKNDFNCIFDEIWMYNVLEHVISPEKCLEKILELNAKKIRIFDWLEVVPHEGHPFFLTEEMFVKNLYLNKSDYKISNISENGCYGKFISIIKNGSVE